MHNLGNQDSDQSSVHSTSNCTSTCVSLWNSNGSNIPQFSYSKSMEMMTDQSELDMNKMNLLRHKLSEQDSSSTQSTSHSHQEVLGTRIENLHQQYVSPQSGDHNIYDKPVEGHMKSVLSLGTPEVALHHQKNDYSHSIAFVPYPFANPYSGVVASYGSHAIIHPQMVGMVTPARVPLPLEPAAEEPIYVNAKQYHGILRRRQLRAKMEAQNKIVKDRKPYLHESRHLHAMKRARGSGGRFLNKTKAQESVSAGSTADENVRGTILLQLGGDGRGGFQLKSDVLSSDNAKMPTSTTPTSSEITTVSNDGGTFQIEEHQIRFSTDFHSHVMSTMQGGGGMVRSGSQQRVPAMR